MNVRLSVDKLKGLLGIDHVVGNYTGEITNIADLRTAGEGDLSFLGSAKFIKHLPASKASVVLVPADQKGEPPENQMWIPVESPTVALAVICRHIERELLPRPDAGIHPTAIVDPSATVDATAHVGPFCVIERDATVGPNVVLQSNVCVEHGASVGRNSTLHHGAVVGWHCSVGENCALYHGAIIGSDGFGYHSDKTGHKRLPQIGIVVLEDDVELGANTCIDRARFAETRVGQGSKIDNLVQIGHNVTIGKHCIICAHVGISGSAEMGNFVVLAGQVGVNGHIKIGDGVIGTGQTGISKDVPAGVVLGGTPGRPHREEMRKQVLLKQLPDFMARVKSLEARME